MGEKKKFRTGKNRARSENDPKPGKKKDKILEGKENSRLAKKDMEVTADGMGGREPPPLIPSGKEEEKVPGIWGGDQRNPRFLIRQHKKKKKKKGGSFNTK